MTDDLAAQLRSVKLDTPALDRQLTEILTHAESDFSGPQLTAYAGGQLKEIVASGRTRLLDAVKSKPPGTSDELAALWNGIVSDFFRNGFWGFVPSRDEPMTAKPAKNSVFVGAFLIFQLFLSLVIFKSAIVYFGGRYSSFPGQGYGYGLAGALFFLIGSLVYIVWKYRNSDF